MDRTNHTEHHIDNNPVDYRLIMARIFYHLPDYPSLLQEFVWQEYDLAPKFPELHRFLDFWRTEIEGPIHSVHLVSHALITPTQMQYYTGEVSLQ